MNRPSFQFYPADWRNNAKLRRCSEAARGAWIDILCVLHDSDEYGVCRWPLRDLARAAGVSLRSTNELVTNDVLKGADRDAEPFVFTPRHAGTTGDPVILVEHHGGPVWYSSRLVRDEYVRQRRGAGSRFTADNQPPKAEPKPSIGERQGDGASSSSSSSKDQKITEAAASVVRETRTPPCPQGEIVALYHAVLPSLRRVREWTPARQVLLRKRWSESPDRQSLEWWRQFFAYVAESDFLMGRTHGQNGEGFDCDLEWLVRPKNFVKVIEGRYENRRVAA